MSMFHPIKQAHLRAVSCVGSDVQGEKNSAACTTLTIGYSLCHLPQLMNISEFRVASYCHLLITPMTMPAGSQVIPSYWSPPDVTHSSLSSSVKSESRVFDICGSCAVCLLLFPFFFCISEPLELHERSNQQPRLLLKPAESMTTSVYTFG